MSAGGAGIPALKREAAEAMRRGDAAAAAAAFDRILAAGAADPQVWYGTSLAARALGQYEKAHHAIDQVLARDRRHVQALIAKADVFAAQKDARAASRYYEEAVRCAGPLDRLPAPVAAEVRRAVTALEDSAGDMLAHLKAELAREGFDETLSSKRFRDSVEVLAGVRERYREEPRVFCFEGLPARGFYDTAEFAWTGALEAATDAIEEELRAYLGEGAPYEPYLSSNTFMPGRAHPLLDNPDWGAIYLWREGVREAGVADRFPKTMAALEAASLDHVPARGPMALFSRLAPKTHINPHTGFLNSRLICHLPIIVPDGCALRVGGDTHVWRRGELVVFSDAMEHEAWNRSEEDRIILLFSIWRPELTEEERRLTGALLRAVASFSQS